MSESSSDVSMSDEEIDVIFDDSLLKFFSMPTLQHVTVVSFIVKLYKGIYVKHQEELYNQCKNWSYKLRHVVYKLLKSTADRVLGALLELPVPSYIREVLSDVVYPMCYELYSWVIYHDRNIFLLDYDRPQKSKTISYIDDSVWTSRGRIDYKETAKSILAKGKELSDAYKFNFACAYCLEDEIAVLAPKVVNETFSLKCIQKQEMVYFWTSYITGDFSKLNRAVYLYNQENDTDYSINECLFSIIMRKGTNIEAIKHIWNKLDYEEKSNQIYAVIEYSCNYDIICILLSQLSEEEQQEAFKTSSREIFLRLLHDWLWERYFLPTVHNMCDFMTESLYFNVLQLVVDGMELNQDDIRAYNRHKIIFKELWQSSPEHLKNSIVENNNAKHWDRILSAFFSKENIDIVKLIFSDMTNIQKKKLIFTHCVIDKCSMTIRKTEWDLLEIFMDFCFSSKEEADHFKQVLVERNGRNISEYFTRHKEWEGLEQFLKWAFKSDDEINLFKQSLAN